MYIVKFREIILMCAFNKGFTVDVFMQFLYLNLHSKQLFEARPNWTLNYNDAVSKKSLSFL